MPTLAFDALDLPPDEAPRRIREARARGVPRWLWPELPVPLWRDATTEVVRATGEVLAGRPAVLDGEGRIGAPALGLAAFLTGTGPLLGHWMERGALSADGDTADLFALHLAHGRARAERMRWMLGDALAALAAAGVEPILVKGAATAHTLFPEPGTRPMSDVDLVVRPAAIGAAERALAGAGFVRLPSAYERRPYHADWRAPGDDGTVHSLALLHRDNPLLLNLRDGFDRHPATGRVRLGWPASTDTVAISGLDSDARALGGAFLVAHLAAHASEHRENLLPIRLADLVLAFRAGVDADAVDALLRARRISHRVYPAIALAERLVPGTVDGRLLDSLSAAAGPRLRGRIAALDLAYLQRLDQPVAGGQAFASRGPLDDARAALRRLFPFNSPGRLAEVYRTRLLRLFRMR
ncbi:MAG TPA: nucleotidyltransferase family protein [Longimicrobium sp.]|nr:nucleotidyltransferase family protein [Longimicrobium sp.]